MQGSAILPRRRAESIGATAPLSTRKAAAWSQYSRLGRTPVALRRAGLCEVAEMGREEKEAASSKAHPRGGRHRPDCTPRHCPCQRRMPGLLKKRAPGPLGPGAL